MSDWLHRKLRDRLPEAVRSRVPERRVRPDESSAVPESPGESAPVVPRTWREEGEWAEPEQSRVMPEAQHEEGWVQWEMGDPVMLDAITAPGTGRVYAVYTGKPQATGFKELEPGVVSAAPGTRGVVGSVGVDFVVVQVPVEELEIDFEGLPKSEARRYERAIGNGATALAFAFSKKDVVPWLDEPEDPDVEWDPVEQQKRQWGGKWGRTAGWSGLELKQTFARVFEKLPGARPEHQQRLVDYLAALEQMLRDEGASDHAARYMAEGRAKHPEAARIIDSLVPGPVDPSYRAGPGRAIDIDDMVEPDYDDVDDEGIVACPECSMETLEELGECEYCGAALDFSQFEAQRTGKWGEKAVVTVDEVVTCS